MDTVKNLENKLKSAKRVALIGNGGISSELAYGLFKKKQNTFLSLVKNL